MLGPAGDAEVTVKQVSQQAPEAAAARDLERLRASSARLGADPRFVQGPGGNTSIKADGLLWIKASGTWLMHADRRDCFVPVALAPLLDAIRDGSPEAEKARSFVVEDRNPSGLRPSIETTVHALMPQRVVIHVHCVETVATAVERDAEASLAARLDGLNWVHVPYRRPGLPLARDIAARRRADADVLVLANHGLVVAADSVAEAESLMRRVGNRLARPPRPAPAPDLEALRRLAGNAYRPAAAMEAHAVATDADSCRIAAGGSLYPDHVVFLGPGAVVAGPRETADDVVARLSSDGIAAPVWILVPGKGVLMREDATEGAEAMARCLADVASRIPRDAHLNYLSSEETAELLDWDAEKHRRALDRRGRAGAP